MKNGREPQSASARLGIVETRRAASLFLAAGQHVVQTTETDVVSPTVTTEDPLALLHQVILQVNELPCPKY